MNHWPCLPAVTPATAGCGYREEALKGISQEVTNCSPGYMEQAPSRGHEASPQSGLGVGCKLYPSSKKLPGLSVRAQARRISIWPLGETLAESE